MMICRTSTSAHLQSCIPACCRECGQVPGVRQVVRERQDTGLGVPLTVVAGTVCVLPTLEGRA